MTPKTDLAVAKRRMGSVTLRITIPLLRLMFFVIAAAAAGGAAGAESENSPE
jgi:hypothetical protein